MYLFYVPHNTIAIFIGIVCQAIWNGYGDEVVSNPTTAGVEGGCYRLLQSMKHSPCIRCLRLQTIWVSFNCALCPSIKTCYTFTWFQAGAPGQHLMSNNGMRRHCVTQSLPTTLVSPNRNLRLVTNTPYSISLSYFRHFREIDKQLDGPFSNSYFDSDFVMYFLQC